MALRNTAIGTGVAFVGAAGVTAALALGATDGAQPLKPASQTTQTATTQTTTTTQAETVHRHRQRGKRVAARRHRVAENEVRHPDQAQRQGSDDGPAHDVNDDSALANDDGPAHDVNDDNGREAGDDSGGHGGNRGPGGGGDD